MCHVLEPLALPPPTGPAALVLLRGAHPTPHEPGSRAAPILLVLRFRLETG